jgi:hypothetical protein
MKMYIIVRNIKTEKKNCEKECVPVTGKSNK